MSTKITLALATGVALFAPTAFAQCPTGNCARVYYSEIAPRYSGFYVFQGACETVAQPCAPVETVQPCEPVTTCEPTSTPAPCDPVETTVPSAENVQVKIREIDECLTGACPLRTVTKTAVKTATAPVRAVANLLASANASRARYGLPALQYDESLAKGANVGANYCARAGQVCHAPGCGFEIVAMNGQGIETAVNQWLNSPPHRALLLNGGFRYAGVSVVRDRSGRCWCAMRFK